MVLAIGKNDVTNATRAKKPYGMNDPREEPTDASGMHFADLVKA